MPEPSTYLGTGRDRQLRIAAVVFGVVVLLYSILIVGQLLAAVALFVWVFVVYLAWRFVRAHERLADAAEQVARETRENESPTPRESATDPSSAEE